MIYTMFIKYQNFDYSCLSEVVLELVTGYKQMARKWEITLEAPLHEEVPSTPLEIADAGSGEATGGR